MFFVNKLDKEKLIDIINCCLESYALKSNKKMLDNEYVFDLFIDEKIAYDKDSNEAILIVCKNNQGNVLYSLVISDYYLYSPDVTMLLDLTLELKEALAIRFGQEYIESLYSYKLKQATEEYTSLALLLENKSNKRK